MLLALLTLFLSWQSGPSGSTRITKSRSPRQEAHKTVWRKVQVPIEQGEISLLVLCRGVFDAYGMDGKQLDFKDHRLPVDSFTSRLLLYGLEKSMKGSLELRRRDEGKTFELAIQKGTLSKGRRAAKKKILQALSRMTGEDLIARQYRLSLPAKIDSLKQLVILVHGLDSRAELFDELATFLESKGHPCARYSYPNDDRISESAARLSAKLKKLAARHEDMRFVLIGHSMGGLLCRELIEEPALYPPRVQSVAFLGTPHQGSYLSPWRSLLDLRDTIRGGFRAQALLDTWRDGFGEAGYDLWPGSTWLQAVAARPRNPKVRYLNILGNRAPLTHESLEKLATRAKQILNKTRGGRLILPKATRALSDLRELEQGKGDCAVALVRGHLEGVPEKILPLDHIALVRLSGILTPRQKPDSHPAWQLLLEFLAP